MYVCIYILYVVLQGTTIKPLVKLIHVKLAQKKTETLNESVHSAVSGIGQTCPLHFNYVIDTPTGIM